MRGRLWALYATQAAAGLFCLIMGISSHSLGATIASMVVFSVFVQAACGCTFGVTPFVSNRSVGLLTGLVAAGGNAVSGGWPAGSRLPPELLAALLLAACLCWLHCCWLHCCWLRACAGCTAAGCTAAGCCACAQNPAAARHRHRCPSPPPAPPTASRSLEPPTPRCTLH
jgi:nitrate/nitrite transporter NarK